jgi:hypothetical protein
MIQHLKFKRELSKLYRKKEALHQAYKLEKKGKSGNELQSIESREQFEATEYTEEISNQITNHLIQKARKRFIPLPENNEDYWKQNPQDRYHDFLTEKGISELRSRLRKEQKESFELTLMILTSTTGVLGALIGLIALIKK